jgi:predicted nucleic acid-binding protein
MILADSSIWIDHLRHRDERMIQLMETVGLLVHPFIIGEVALGHVKNRDVILAEMSQFQQSVLATDTEVLQLINRMSLMGTGLGLIDIHLLGSVLVTIDAKLWTRDKKLAAVADSIGVLAPLR